MIASTPARRLSAIADELTALVCDLDDADRIDCIRLLEVLRGVVAATQARMTAAFVRSQRADQRARGVPASRVGRGVTAQVALARRMSPHQAERWVGFAMIAPDELPHTFRALQNGETSEWRAMIVARDTGWLSREDRAEADRRLAAKLANLGDKATSDATRTCAYALDPHGYVDHLAKAANDRHVSVRPAPDVMTRLSALLPMTQGVAVHVALSRAADAARAAGDARTRGQIMADTLVERCTGQSRADDVGVEVQVVVPADVLFAEVVGAAHEVTAYTSRAAEATSRGGARHAPLTTSATTASSDTAPSDTAPLDLARERRARRRRRARDRRHEPALLIGYGPIPAAIARGLVLDRSAHAPTWLRRIYECPETGELVAMESRRRTFTAGQRSFITTRDQHCRTPFCGAPIRHIDHVTPWATSSRTRVEDGDGLCEACNYNKQGPGWRSAAVGAGPAPDIEIVTPTGHHYLGRAPTFSVAHRPH